jgi:23S rRNA (cytidine2498-2'-O)-methyltransferase
LISNIYALGNIFVGTANRKNVKNAIKELQTIDPDIKIIDRYPDGIFTFKISCHREVLLFKLQEKPPIFLRHIHPVDRLFFIPMGVSAPDLIPEGVLTLSDRIKPGRKTAVQARRIPGDYDYTLFTIKKNLDPVIQERFNVVPVVKRPQQIISVLIVDATEINFESGTASPLDRASNEHPNAYAWKEICLMGIGTPKENLNEWAGGEVRLSKDTEQISKSESKLQEAFELFPIEITSGKRALDLGASPGGWTRFLHLNGFEVTSVDKAPLDKDVLSLKGVRYLKRDALHFRDEANSYDLLVNDITQNPVQSAKAALSVSEVLKTGAPMIMTLKLPGNKLEDEIEKARKTLESSFNIRGIRQLYHNRDEVTLWATKK